MPPWCSDRQGQIGIEDHIADGLIDRVLAVRVANVPVEPFAKGVEPSLETDGSAEALAAGVVGRRMIGAAENDLGRRGQRVERRTGRRRDRAGDGRELRKAVVPGVLEVAEQFDGFVFRQIAIEAQGHGLLLLPEQQGLESREIVRAADAGAGGCGHGRARVGVLVVRRNGRRRGGRRRGYARVKKIGSDRAGYIGRCRIKGRRKGSLVLMGEEVL